MTVSTGSATKEIGLWHLAETVTVTGLSSEGSLMPTTPEALVLAMIALSMGLPTMTWASGIGSPGAVVEDQDLELAGEGRAAEAALVAVVAVLVGVGVEDEDLLGRPW